MRRIAALAVALLCLSVGSFAATLIVSTSGTYSAGTPTTIWTAPNAAWTFSFNVASNPLVNSSVVGQNFDAVISNATYTLNNVPVNIGPVDVTFWSAGNGGLINIGVLGSPATTTTPANGIQILGPQAYSGTEAVPTILTNIYAETANTLRVSSTNFVQANGTVTIALATSATPVPSSFLLTLAGLALGMFYLTSRRSVRA